MASVRSEDSALATPCRDWDVRALANHNRGGPAAGHAAVRGESRLDFTTEVIEEDPAEDYRRAKRLLVARRGGGGSERRWGRGRGSGGRGDGADGGAHG